MFSNKFELDYFQLKKLLSPDATVTGMVKKILRAINKLGKEAALSGLYVVKWITLKANQIRTTHFKLRSKLNPQKTSGSNYWNRNNYRTISCSNYYNLTCQVRYAYNWNRKLLQNSTIFALTTVAVVEKPRPHIDKQWPLLRFQNEFRWIRMLKPRNSLWFHV